MVPNHTTVRVSVKMMSHIGALAKGDYVYILRDASMTLALVAAFLEIRVPLAADSEFIMLVNFHDKVGYRKWVIKTETSWVKVSSALRVAFVYKEPGKQYVRSDK